MIVPVIFLHPIKKKIPRKDSFKRKNIESGIFL
jgi:hypothetical protein